MHEQLHDDKMAASANGKKATGRSSLAHSRIVWHKAEVNVANMPSESQTVLDISDFFKIDLLLPFLLLQVDTVLKYPCYCLAKISGSHIFSLDQDGMASLILST